MRVELWPIDRPVAYARNARTIPQQAIDKVAASVREFGFRQPIVVDKDGTIVVGHTRLLAAQKLGLSEVPVHIADNLTKAQIKAYRLADNRVAQETSFDNDLLALELGDLKLDGFDLDLTGFNSDEIAALEALGNSTQEGLTDEDAVPETPAQPVTVEGDLWVLGNHRLLCGDSTSVDAVDRLTTSAPADLVFTDPPYGVSFQSGMSKGGTATRFEKLKNDDTILEVFPTIYSALRNDGAAFVWTSHQVYPIWRDQFKDIYKSTIIWHKPGGGIGDLKGDYATDYEMCLFCVKGRVHFREKRGMAVWRVSKDNVTEYKHPTQKPVELAERAVLDFTDPGYSVLNLFGGSGSTLIACEKTGRSARLMEIDPKYCDVILQRWADFTGKDPVREDGTKWSELKPASKPESKKDVSKNATPKQGQKPQGKRAA
jgi:DNA modification methylase